MIAAILNDEGIVIDTKVLNSLDEMPNAVVCPDWVGIGMNINTPMPENFTQSSESSKEELLKQLKDLTQKIESI